MPPDVVGQAELCIISGILCYYLLINYLLISGILCYYLLINYLLISGILCSCC